MVTEITAFTTMRNLTPFPTMQMAVAVLRVHRQSGTPQILLFLRPNPLAQVIPSKVGALQVVRQAHRIARAVPIPPTHLVRCMQFGLVAIRLLPKAMLRVVIGKELAILVA